MTDNLGNILRKSRIRSLDAKSVIGHNTGTLHVHIRFLRTVKYVSLSHCMFSVFQVE